MIAIFLCFVGASPGLWIALVRLPSLTDTKLDLLTGTLQAAAVSLLFIVAALLIVLMLMIHRQPRQLTAISSTEQKAQG